MPAPGGAWDSADNGTYTVSMLPTQVADNGGLFVPAGPLGTVVVALAETPTPPTATLSAANLTAPGGIYHYFQVAYQDNVAVQFSTIGSGDVRVTGPGGDHSSARWPISPIRLACGRPPTACRRPGRVGLGGQRHLQRCDGREPGLRHRRHLRPGRCLGSFSASFSDTTAPSAVLTASNVTTPGGIYHYVSVAYSDNVAVAFGTIDANDVLVTGPGGYSQMGFLANLVHSAGTWTANYRIPARAVPGAPRTGPTPSRCGRARRPTIGQLCPRRRSRDVSASVAAPLTDVLVTAVGLDFSRLTMAGRLKQGTLEVLLQM